MLDKVIIKDKNFYLAFDGRISREQYLIHWFVPMFIIGIVMMLLGNIIPVLPPLYSLIVLVPAIMITTRRLHDRGKSGYWQFLLFIPLVGVIWFIYDCLISPGQPGANEYGPEPDHPTLASVGLVK